jgi:hypothetical protein
LTTAVTVLKLSKRNRSKTTKIIIKDGMHVHCNAKNANKKVHRVDRPAEHDDKKKFEATSDRLYAENQRRTA